MRKVKLRVSKPGYYSRVFIVYRGSGVDMRDFYSEGFMRAMFGVLQEPKKATVKKVDLRDRLEKAPAITFNRWKPLSSSGFPFMGECLECEKLETSIPWNQLEIDRDDDQQYSVKAAKEGGHKC